MDQAMIQEMHDEQNLREWWEGKDLEGKEFCSLQEDGSLILNYDKRVLASLNAGSAEAVMKALAAKYAEAANRFAELKAEWDEAADRLKLGGKVMRYKEFLNHVPAAGDFEILYRQLGELENEITDLANKDTEVRMALVRQAEEIAASDNWKEGSAQLKEIGDQWKKLGFTHDHKLLGRLEEARANFFERKRKHFDEQEKDMLQNLDLKLELVEKAEGLSKSENWKETSEVFKQLMEQWKSIGRTMHDKNEELWNRFIQAKNEFFERKKEHYRQIQTEQEANYELKKRLVEKAEVLKESTDWAGTTKALSDIMDEWKNTGRVPADKADELWNRLTAVRDHFFQAKRDHFETVKVSLEANLATKRALLKRAESIKNSSNWRDVTGEMNELMAEWKNTGAVPKEHSEKIWKQFLAARKHFFDRKDADREKRRAFMERQAEQRLQQTMDFCKTLEQEIQEEHERIADFRNGLTDITPGPKAEELRKHLEYLIAEGGRKIIQKQEKLAEVRKQLAALEAKKEQPGQPSEDDEGGETAKDG